ncbi:MAG: penicillin-binding protein 1B [Gammaproteobacteria bacterium]|nr:penicillin-binding protein 1B [Gammaproteobacteria bacterium]MDH5591761.1 penicillin-binding protein 1B [Gammaproteobacteria bacterium]
MATKKATKLPQRRPRRTNKNVKFGFKKKLARIAIKLFFAVVVISGLGFLYLDTHIRNQFEGKRWALPAKVYARPLELYAGLPMSLAELKIELRGLGYQFVKKVTHPGQAEFSETRAIIYSRGFQFPDGIERAQQLILEFSGSQLTRIQRYQGDPIALVRLEPILIGGIYPLNNEDRDLIQLHDAPHGLTDALIAIEDRDFYQHVGISLKGISRAMWVNIKAGRFVQGGSTLTQQLIKNFYLTSERSLARKLLEVPMAMLLELHYSKDEILEAYLNEVYLGQEGARAIHGFGLAAQYYFAQPIQELKLHQLALLAGLVKGPSYYDPRRHPQRAKKRRDLVLKVLHNQGKITDKQYQQSIATHLGIIKQASLLKGAYPAYLDLVKRQLRQSYRDQDLSTEGLRIFTSLNPIVQHKAETALVSTINKLENWYGNNKVKGLQGSMVVTNPQTGEVMAIIGGRNTRYQGFNRALDAVRPVGSLIKPAIYLTAVEQDYTLASKLDDSPYNLTMQDGKTWNPENFDHQSHGDVALHTALAHSYNLSTVRLGMSIGLNPIINTLERLGVSRPIDPYPSLLLGAQGLSPIEVAAMYQTMASNGFQMPLRSIRLVTDSAGQELSRYPFQLKQTISSSVLHLLQYMLQETARSGTARSIYQHLDPTINVAGKTGTSDDQRDSWFAGFSGNRLAIVWLGRDDNKPLPFTGSGGALKAWISYMSNETLEPFIAPMPEDIEYLWIAPKSGLVSNQTCQDAQQLPFITGTGPTSMDDCVKKNNDPDSNSANWLHHLFR